jgi:peptidoglycan/xylan/chitin deacetylase (PgdA/CDA1 family)
MSEGDPKVIASVELPQGDKLVAFTFDDGPSRWTPAILDVFREYSGRGTFFILGRSVNRRADVLRRTLAEGHELGNHLLSHRSAEHLEDEEIRRELTETGQRVRAAAGCVPQLVRPPYGADSERVARIAAEIGLGPTIFWSLSGRDWRERTPEPIVERVLDQVSPGAVVGLHDAVAPQPRPWNRRVARATRSRTPTVLAMAEILRELSERGYGFVTVSELLRAAAPER